MTLTHCVVDLTTRRIERNDGTSLRLTTREAELMGYLARAGDRDVPREELLTEVWGYAASSRTRAVDSTMTRLRRKVEGQASDPDHLLSVTGVGYRFVLPAGNTRAPATAPEPLAPVVSAVQPVPPRHDAFIGRQAELDELGGRIQPGRLVTLVGVGGIGKSRLAHEAADAWLAAGGEVRWLKLDGALTLVDVGIRLAQALGISEPPTDRAALRLLQSAPDALWVFDDADGCLDVLTSFAEEMRAGVPGAAWMVTARRALGLPGERVVQVRRLDRADARLLFAERADLETQSESMEQIVEVLDGHPLALELAAARSRALGVDALLSSTRSWLELLADRRSQRPARHGSLRLALDASWESVGEPSRMLWMQLSETACSATVQLIEALAGATGLDGLEELAENSLLLREGSAWRMSEVVRAYGRARLAEHADVDEIRETGTVAVIDLAGHHLEGVRGPDIAVHLDALVRLQPELERIQQRSVDPVRIAEVFLLMGPAMITRGVDGRMASVGRALAQEVPAATRASVCAEAARLMQTREPSLRERERRSALIDEAIALAEQEGLHSVKAVACRLQAMVWFEVRNFERAHASFEASIGAAQLAGRADEEALTLGCQAFLDVHEGRSFDGRFLRALRVAGRGGAYWAESIISSWYADLLDNAGRADEAQPHAISALEVFEQLGDWSRAAWMGVRLVAAWRQQGQHARAEEWLERALGTHLSDPFNTWHLTAMSHRAAVALETGNLEAARAHAERVLDVAQKAPMPMAEATGRMLQSWVALAAGQYELAHAQGVMGLELADSHISGSHKVTLLAGCRLAAAWTGQPVEVPAPLKGMSRAVKEQGLSALLLAHLVDDEALFAQWHSTVTAVLARDDHRARADLTAIDALHGGETPTFTGGGWIARLCVARFEGDRSALSAE